MDIETAKRIVESIAVHGQHSEAVLENTQAEVFQAVCLVAHTALENQGEAFLKWLTNTITDQEIKAIVSQAVEETLKELKDGD